MNSSAIKLYALGLIDVKIYLYIFLFILGCLLFLHYRILLPDTGIAVYRYALRADVLTAVASPVVYYFIQKNLLLQFVRSSKFQWKRMYLPG